MDQGVKDALADAETLREFVRSESGATPVHIFNAFNFGESVKRAIDGEIPQAPCPCGCGRPAVRWHFAERAAHAAFLAVPGLREISWRDCPNEPCYRHADHVGKCAVEPEEE